MDTVSATHVARPFHVMITNEGVHPAWKWAQLTAALIAEPRIDALPDARVDIHTLKLRFEKILFDVFNEVKAASSEADVMVITSQATRRIVEEAVSTRWAHVFAAKPIQFAIEELIRRNLLSVNEIALRTE